MPLALDPVAGVVRQLVIAAPKLPDGPPEAPARAAGSAYAATPAVEEGFNPEVPPPPVPEQA